MTNQGVSLDITGDITVPGTITETGTAGSNIGLSVAGITDLGNTLNGTNGNFTGGITAGTASITGLLGSGSLSTGTASVSYLQVSNNVTINGTLGVTGKSTLGLLSAGSSTLSSLSTSGSIFDGGSFLTSNGVVQVGTSVAASGGSSNLFTIGANSSGYPFSVDQYGAVLGKSFGGSEGATATFTGNLTGNVNGGSIIGSSFLDTGAFSVTSTGTSSFSGGLSVAGLTDTGNLSVSGSTVLSGTLNTGAISGTSAVFSGTVTAANFSGSMTLGSGGVTMSGVLPIANGGTGASTAVGALANLGVTSGGYLNTALLTTGLIPGADIVSGSVTSTQLNTTGVAAGTYTSVIVGLDGRVTGGSTGNVYQNQITDGSGDTVAVGTTTGILYTVGSSTVGNWTTTGLMVGNGTLAKNKLDVSGAVAIGTSYAGSVTAPANGLIVQGAEGIGTSNVQGYELYVNGAEYVNGNVVAGTFYGSGAGLTGIGTGSITGVVPVVNGGTGNSTQTTNGVAYYNGSTITTNSGFVYSGGNVGIGTSVATNKLDVNGGATIGYTGTVAPTNGLLVSGNVGLGTNTANGANLQLAVNGGETIGSYAGSNINPPANGLVVSGNVGIGTTAPGYALDVWPSGGFSAQRLYSTSTSGVGLTLQSAGTGGKNWSLISTGSASGGGAGNLLLNDLTDSLVAMTITSSGYVGIGTLTPQSKLHIYGGEVQVGSSGVSCSSNNQGAIRYAAGDLSFCDNANTWETVDTSGAGPGGDYVEVTSVAPNPTGTDQGYLGATATLGAIVSGDGSISDVTLENKSGAIGLELLTGSTNLYAPGNLGIGTNLFSGANTMFAVNGGMTLGTYAATNINAPSNGLVVSGNVGMGSSAPTMPLTVNGEILSMGYGTNPGQFVAVGGNYGFVTRNDGTNSYMLLTNSGAPYGVYNSLRPITINDSSGMVTLDSTGAGGVTVGGTLGIGTATYSGANTSLAVNGGETIGTYANTNVNAPANGLVVSGNVGIGTSYPGTTTLAVNGNSAIGFSSNILVPANSLAVGDSVTIGTTLTSYGNALTVVGNSHQGMAIISNNATANTALGIGRLSTEASLGIAGSASQYSTFTSAGDAVLRNITNNLFLSAQNTTGNIIFTVGTSGGTETKVMTITNTDSVAIGTSVANGSNAELAVNGGMTVGNYANQNQNPPVAGAIISGNVGINTTSPQARFQVYNGEAIVGSSGAGCASNNQGAIRYATGSLYFCDNVNVWESIDSSGSAGSGDYIEVTSVAPNPTGTDQGYLGASATLGAIVSGQGSTSDVTLENKSGTVGLELLTGTNNLYAPGNLGIGTATFNGANTFLAVNGGATFGTYANTNVNAPSGGIVASGNVGIGSSAPTMPLVVNGEILSMGYGANPGQLALVGGNYGYVTRNDGTNTYMLLTSSGAPYGTYNSLRPITINDSTGMVTLDSTGAGGVTVGGTLGIGTAVYSGTNTMLAVNGGETIGTYANTNVNAPLNGLIVSGNVGIGTSNPTYALSLGNSGAQEIWVERSAGASTGKALTVQAGGAGAGATNASGGTLTLSSGISTGSGGGAIALQTYPPGSSGTGDNTPYTAVFHSKQWQCWYWNDRACLSAR